MFNINDENKMCIDPYKIDAKEFDRSLNKIREFVTNTPLEYGDNSIRLQGKILDDKNCSIYLTKDSVEFLIVDKFGGDLEGIGKVDRKEYKSVQEAALKAFEKSVDNLNGDD